MIKETHARSITKAVIYRVLSVIAIMLISYFAMGASAATAGKVGLIVVVLGTTIYYIHERLWIRTGWHRSLEGKDNQWRSISKTIIYRLLTMTASFFIATFILGSSGGGAAGFAIAQAVTNMTLFYIVERIFNHINWGRTVEK
jgi:uncharacterized membrane protein